MGCISDNIGQRITHQAIRAVLQNEETIERHITVHINMRAGRTNYKARRTQEIRSDGAVYISRNAIGCR